MEKQTINNLIGWIKNYVTNAHANGVCIGMSGGKDSLVVAKLCCEAIGNKNVFGIIMPNGEMADIDDALSACKLLNINYQVVDISGAYNAIIDSVKSLVSEGCVSDVTTINTAPRVRMTTLYAFAGSLNYLVANTSNLSEAMVGYTTKFGDNVGDFYPLLSFTKTEVCEIGTMLGLPDELVNKKPSDGLSGKSDEDKLGFTYDELDKFIRQGEKGEHFDAIMSKHKSSAHKRSGIAKFNFDKPNYFNETKF